MGGQRREKAMEKRQCVATSVVRAWSQSAQYFHSRFSNPFPLSIPYSPFPLSSTTP